MSPPRPSLRVRSDMRARRLGHKSKTTLEPSVQLIEEVRVRVAPVWE